MSDVIPHKKSLRHGRLRSFSGDPVKIKYSPYTPSEVHFSDGKVGTGTCLGCHDTPCIELPNAATSLGGPLSSFPGDPSRDVCPKNAIDWDISSQSPIIEEDKCIGCGLCALFCPYGAISISQSTGKALIEKKDPSMLTELNNEEDNPSYNYKKTGSIVDINHHFLSSLPDIKKYLSDIQSNRLVRNMLLAYDLKASVRRKGDTNVRIDGIIDFWDKKIGVLEIELSKSVLDSPRALLEDISVIHSRYNIPVKDILPVSVILTYPSKRAEYYQVIKDIDRILDVRINTISIGLLCMAVLTSKFKNKLTLISTTNRTHTLYRSLFMSLPAKQRVEPYPGALRASK